MKNLTLVDSILDTLGKREYRLYAHRRLTQSEEVQAILKPSLHTSLGLHAIHGHIGAYEIVNVVAADGWEGAE